MLDIFWSIFGWYCIGKSECLWSKTWMFSKLAKSSANISIATYLLGKIEIPIPLFRSCFNLFLLKVYPMLKKGCLLFIASIVNFIEGISCSMNWISMIGLILANCLTAKGKAMKWLRWLIMKENFSILSVIITRFFELNSTSLLVSLMKIVLLRVILLVKSYPKLKNMKRILYLES